MSSSSVLITGASGFIGTALVKFLLKKGYIVFALSHQKKPKLQHACLTWISHFEQITTPIDYVINLAGQNIGEKRWTAQRKQELIQSRVETTEKLYQYLTENQFYPKVIISGSAIGFYGIDEQQKWEQICTEQSAPQDIFMSTLCQKWEQVTQQYPKQNTKIIRLGVVLGQDGGILKQLLFPIQWNLVGKIASGKQPFVWIHLDDVLAAIEFLMTQTTEESVFNLVAPEQNTQADFVRLTAKLLNRHPIFTLPSCISKLAFGEQAQLVMNGQYVQPQALQKAGFQFQYPTLDCALQNLLQ